MVNKILRETIVAHKIQIYLLSSQILNSLRWGFFLPHFFTNSQNKLAKFIKVKP